MVTLEQLEALDLTFWLRSGTLASKISFCDESSLSRRLAHALKVFELQFDRSSYELAGDQTLLNLQRAVHQHARFKGSRALRLDATHFVRQILQDPPLPEGWILGPCDHLGFDRIVSLLKSRVIDAWITSDLFDLPEDEELEVLHLWHWPVLLSVHRCHPLAGQRHLTEKHLASFPSLILPYHLYPGLAAALQAKGFGRKTQMRRYDKGSWSSPSQDAMTIVYASCLSLEADNDLVALDWDLGLTGGEALVYRHDVRGYPWIPRLIDDLMHRQDEMVKRHPTLVPLL